MTSKYRIIIWEGPDLVGKSTLKKEFELKTNFRHLCVDRMFVTSLVYNAFKNRHLDIQSDLINDLERFIADFNPLFVVVKSDINVIQERFDNRDDWYIKKDELKNISEMYDNTFKILYKSYPNNFMLLINNSKEDIYTNIDKVLNKLKE